MYIYAYKHPSDELRSTQHKRVCYKSVNDGISGSRPNGDDAMKGNC